MLSVVLTGQRFFSDFLDLLYIKAHRRFAGPPWMQFIISLLRNCRLVFDFKDKNIKKIIIWEAASDVT